MSTLTCVPCHNAVAGRCHQIKRYPFLPWALAAFPIDLRSNCGKRRHIKSLNRRLGRLNLCDIPFSFFLFRAHRECVLCGNSFTPYKVSSFAASINECDYISCDITKTCCALKFNTGSSPGMAVEKKRRTREKIWCTLIGKENKVVKHCGDRSIHCSHPFLFHYSLQLFNLCLLAAVEKPICSLSFSSTLHQAPHTRRALFCL